MTTPDPAPPRRPYIVLGELEVMITGPDKKVVHGAATFYYNHQQTGSVWLELRSGQPTWPFQTAVKVSAKGLKPFEAHSAGTQLRQSGGALTVSERFDSSQEPLESVKVSNLKQVVFALLDCPFPKGDTRWPSGPPLRPFTFHCAQFDIELGAPVAAHQAITRDLGSIPKALTHTGTLQRRDGSAFESEAGQVALGAAFDVVSFAAGRWIAQSFVEGLDETGTRRWFLWGTSRVSPPTTTHSWFHPDHPEWLTLACDGLLEFKNRSTESEEILRKLLYWYTRSNTMGAGVDGSLILTMCALELLSWFVIVRRSGSLSEAGYGQLASATERLRLMLTLLGMPKSIPVGLADLAAFAKREQWPDMTVALVEARNYLVHPTQSKAGKRRTNKDFPWYELWNGAQWLLELTILRLIGYDGHYHNRTRLRDLHRVERVPWT
jgi:hypothetical protein